MPSRNTKLNTIRPTSAFVPSRRDPIHWLSKDLKATFGGPVRKANLDAGFTCPNRDGTLSVGGCSFCDPGGSGPDDLVAGEAWHDRLVRLAGRATATGYAGVLAYFQAHTNTYGRTPEEFGAMLERTLAVRGVVGIIIGTRPDCLPPRILNVLAAFNRRTRLWVDVGMQTIHDATLSAVNRGHKHADTVAAVEALRALGIPFVLHVMLGLPGEDDAMMRATLAEVTRLRPWGVKLHPLHVVNGSALAARWKAGALPLLGREVFAAHAADLLETLPPETTIHRLTGERPEGILLAPDWCRDKRGTLGAVTRELARRASWQGKRAGS